MLSATARTRWLAVTAVTTIRQFRTLAQTPEADMHSRLATMALALLWRTPSPTQRLKRRAQRRRGGYQQAPPDRRQRMRAAANADASRRVRDSFARRGTKPRSQTMDTTIPIDVRGLRLAYGGHTVLTGPSPGPTSPAPRFDPAEPADRWGRTLPSPPASEARADQRMGGEMAPPFSSHGGLTITLHDNITP